MSGAPLPGGPVEPEELVSFGPREGWTTFAALAVMLFTVAKAIDDAGWAGIQPGTVVSQTAFLPVGVLLAVAVGAALAKSRLPMLKAHLLGSTLGAAYLLISISSVVSSAPALEERLRALNLSVSIFVNDVLVTGTRSAETSVFLLTLGALLWGAGQFAAFAIFRWQRPIPAIAVAALPLLINVSLTVREQYLHVVIFAAAGLALLVRLNLLQQTSSWQRREIGSGSEVSSAFLRSGVTFIAIALIGSTLLAANTRSAPLARAWRDIDTQLLEIGYEIHRVVGGVSGEVRGPSLLFAPIKTIQDRWESSEGIEFTTQTSDGTPRYLRGYVYNWFDGRDWRAPDGQRTVAEPDADILASTAESLANVPGRRKVTLQVTPEKIGGEYIVTPDGPYSVSQAVEVEVHVEEDGRVGGFITARVPEGLIEGVPFTVEALVRETEGEGRLTANKLAAAGLNYPQWVERRYTQIVEGSIGERTRTTAQLLVEQLPPEQRDPYHVAKAIQDFLRSRTFTYTTDVTGLCAGETSLVECFLRPGMRRGFCEYFASTMVMMLRTRHIPARYVVGYLPGRQRSEGLWEVPRSAAHAWVEVYFPGYGWVPFDPTPGNTENRNEATELEIGPPVPTLPPLGPAATPPYFDDVDRDLGTVTPPSPSGGGGPLTGVFAVLLGAGALLLLLTFAAIRLRRLPRPEPDLAYRSVARMAARFGHGPRPSQTAYEYAEGLSEVLPALRSDLRLVATAKVETTYGARRLTSETLLAVRRAYARVRLGLLRLLFRWPRRLPGWPRKPRDISD